MLDPEARRTGTETSAMALNREYQPKVRMHHEYFLASMQNFRAVEHFACDVCLIIGTIVFLFGGLNILVAKGKIEPYW